MICRLFLSVLFFAFALPCFAQKDPAVDSRDAKCKQYLEIPLPAEAAQAPAPKQWPDCNSYKLYSGIDTKVDYVAARKCAWSERLAQQALPEPELSIGSIFGGAGVLAVLYANGEGIDQNKPLALRLACESELDDRFIMNIEALPEQNHLIEKRLQYCNYAAYSTIEMNFCAAWGSEIAAQKRQDSLDLLMQKWPQKDRDAFKFLRQTSENYVEAHGRGEVYQGGTIRALRTIGVEEHQRDKFLEAVLSFESGYLPKGSHVDFQRADADLNATYGKTLALAAAQDSRYDDGLIVPDGVREAERAWLKYRDAWVSFAKIHYPNTNPDAWLTLLTTNRVWSLRWTMCVVGWNDPACEPR